MTAPSSGSGLHPPGRPRETTTFSLWDMAPITDYSMGADILATAAHKLLLEKSFTISDDLSDIKTQDGH